MTFMADIVTEVQSFIDKIHSFDLFLIGAGNVSYEFTPKDYPHHSTYSKTLAMLLGDTMTEFEVSNVSEKDVKASRCLEYINCAYAEGVVDNRERLRAQLKECKTKRTELEKLLAEAHQNIENLRATCVIEALTPTLVRH